MLIIILITSFILSFAGIWLIRHYALKKAILDIPNARSSHNHPTPRGAGFIIALVFFLATAFLNYLKLIPSNLAAAFLIGGSLVALIGCLDDLYSLKAKIRALFHLIAATIATFVLHGIPNILLNSWTIHLGLLGSLIAIIGVVWFINLYNFMDGIDGLAGSEALFVCLAAGGILWPLYMHAISYICLVLAAIIFGFLCWNWAPAKIFLGDVGSGLLGFIFAILIIECVRQNITSPFFWFILLSVFIFDATFTLLHRITRKEKWYEAHRDHIYQRLIIMGSSHRQVTLLITAVNILIVFPIAYIAYLKPTIAFWLFLLVTIFFGCLWFLLIRLFGRRFKQLTINSLNS